MNKKKQYPATEKYFSENYRERYFSTEEILKNDDLTVVVRGHLLVEMLIEMWLRENFEHDQILLNRNFTYFMKIELAHSLGLIDKGFFIIFQKFGEIRNAFAHQLGISFNDLNKEVNEFVNRIGERDPEVAKLFKKYKEYKDLKLLFGIGTSFLLGFLAKESFKQKF